MTPVLYSIMSTQQLGDRPPVDDHYFDLENEESCRAPCGGRNPNGPAWNPQKMELCRIVDRLLEERRYLPPRQVEQAVPHKVKRLHGSSWQRPSWRTAA